MHHGNRHFEHPCDHFLMSPLVLSLHVHYTVAMVLLEKPCSPCTQVTNQLVATNDQSVSTSLPETGCYLINISTRLDVEVHQVTIHQLQHLRVQWLHVKQQLFNLYLYSNRRAKYIYCVNIIIIIYSRVWTSHFPPMALKLFGGKVYNTNWIDTTVHSYN